MISSLNAFSTEMDGIITNLTSNPSMHDESVITNAGGPYSANEGTPIGFDGSASSTGFGINGSKINITSYEWDLDGNGIFDDFASISPLSSPPASPLASFIYNQSFQGFAGLKTTNRVWIFDLRIL